MYVKLPLAGLIFVSLICGCSAEKQSDIQKADTVEAALPDFSSVNTSDVFVYECGDSLRITAHVTRDSTWLFLPDTSLKLTSARSGSGAKFQNGSYLYWSKGDEALLQLPRGSLMNCTSIARQKSWQAAKLRGVDFRALGQEPGWILEITKNKHIKYIGNYGQDTVYTPVPDSENKNGQTVYHAETDTDTLTVEISDESCSAMSGLKLPKTVSVTVDGETYRGCGRALN